MDGEYQNHETINCQIPSSNIPYSKFAVHYKIIEIHHSISNITAVTICLVFTRILDT